MSDAPRLGSIGWLDLTVDDAEGVRDFYAEVVGWTPEPLDMGGYSDFNMTGPGDDQPRAGVCHARGGNAELPPVWLPYIYIADMDNSLERCRARGGSVVSGPKTMGKDRYAVIRDPAGAHIALYQSAKTG